MREKPILFSGPMVRAILEGRKTQTRRIVKPNKGCTLGRLLGEIPERGAWWFVQHGANPPSWEYHPLVLPGDRLWVRETFATRNDLGRHVEFRADRKGIGDERPFSHIYDEQTRWRPSIFMPRWASRITLEVTEVRCERLNEISDKDCFAEGIQSVVNAGQEDDGTVRGAFRALWESINGPNSFDDRWVWVYGFKVVSR